MFAALSLPRASGARTWGGVSVQLWARTPTGNGAGPGGGEGVRTGGEGGKGRDSHTTQLWCVLWRGASGMCGRGKGGGD